MSYDISTSEFLDIEVIDPQSVLDRCKKEVFLLDIASAQKELVTNLKGTLVVVCTIIENLDFSLIRLVTCICL